jgi:hypothetical protein
MKVFIILALAAAANAQFYNAGLPINYGYSALAPGLAYSSPAVIAPAVTKTQYHSQDELGQASYGHSEPGQAHAAIRDAAGNVRGSYAYIDPNGKEVRVNYVAGHGGFRAESNALPQAPVSILAQPLPVQDTPEVVAARAAHFAAHAEARSRSKRQAVLAASPLAYSNLGAHHLGYNTLGLNTLGYNTVGLNTLGYNTVGLNNLGYSAVAAPVVSHQLAYSAPVVAAAQPLRQATLTKVVNTPGHAVSYRVD